MIDDHHKQISQLQGEELRSIVNALLVTGDRRVSDEEHQRFIRSLDTPRRSRVNAPKATPGVLRRIGFKMRGGGEDKR